MQIAIESRGPALITQIKKAVADTFTKLDNSTYIQYGVVVSIIMLVAWSITFKVTTEAQITRLKEKLEEANSTLIKIQTTLPSKDWLELKFSTLEAQLGNKQKK